MSKNRGFVLVDTLIGIYIVTVTVFLVMMMAVSRNRFHYDFNQQEMYDIWNDPSRESIYTYVQIPEGEIVTEDTLLPN